MSDRANYAILSRSKLRVYYAAWGGPTIQRELKDGPDACERFIRKQVHEPGGQLLEFAFMEGSIALDKDKKRARFFGGPGEVNYSPAVQARLLERLRPVWEREGWTIDWARRYAYDFVAFLGLPGTCIEADFYADNPTAWETIVERPLEWVSMLVARRLGDGWEVRASSCDAGGAIHFGPKLASSFDELPVPDPLDAHSAAGLTALDPKSILHLSVLMLVLGACSRDGTPTGKRLERAAPASLYGRIMQRGLAVALLLVTGCGARSDLDGGIAEVADERRCNELFAHDGDEPQLSVAATSNGFVLAGGYDEVIRFGSHTLTSKDRALFVVRLDASCDVVWARQFSVAASFVDLAVTSDGGVVIAGMSRSAGVEFGDGHQGDGFRLDVFVARLDPAGAVLWSRVVPGTRTSFLASGRRVGVAVDAADGVVLTGSFDGTTDCGGGTLASGAADAEAAFVARFDGDGVFLWSTALAAVDGHISAERIAIDHTGTIVFAGDLRGTLDLAGTTLDSAPFPARAFIAKLDAAGQAIAARLLPDPPFEGAFHVVEAMAPHPSNGAFLVAASYYESAVVDAKQVLHLDDAGEVLWMKKLPFFDNGSMFSVLVADAEGGVWYVDSCHSWVCSFIDGEAEKDPNSDVVVAHFDASGAAAWRGRWGSKRGWDFGQAATIDGEGRLIFGGNLSDTLDFGLGPLVVSDAGSFPDADDLFLVRLP